MRRPGEETRHAVLSHEAAVRQREVGEAREAGSQVQHHGVAQVLVAQQRQVRHQGAVPHQLHHHPRGAGIGGYTLYYSNLRPTHL